MTEHHDIIVIGAGLSGIGAACHLARRLPDADVLLLEMRGQSGGTWDLFRYPGVRSDSDMFTLGYAFAPWTAPKAIAAGDTILQYIRDTARTYGIDDRIRYHRRVVRVEWSAPDVRWTVHVDHTDTGERSTLTCDFLYGCTGYYDYTGGFAPEFPGMADFAGTVVHPQQWPADLDYAGKRVAVVGSGATAVTLVPALATQAAHVTMVQRSPTHILPLPSRDPVADAARRFLPPQAAAGLLRWKNLLVSQALFAASRRWPDRVRRMIRAEQAKILPADFRYDPDLDPDYDPWDQRLCLAADGDFFHALADGHADIVTDTVDTFTEHGLRLASGREVEVDVVVLATGLRLLPIGGIDIVVAGRPIRLRDEVTYKGAMLSDVPNFVFTVGYTNASWTLKADLVADYTCRLLRYMRRKGYTTVTPLAPPDGGAAPIIDLQSGYVLRSLDLLPQQGSRRPWRLRQNYPLDLVTLRYAPLRDEGVRFGRQGRTNSESGRSARSSASRSPRSSPRNSSDTPASARA